MRKIPPLAAVRVFEAVARHGNFTRAAEELGMTQAAVSYQMRLLEERLGTPLFARSGRGIVLTEMGRRAAPQVTAAFDMLDETFAVTRAESESVLTISAPRTFATNWLAPRMGTFQLARPALAVRLDVTDQLIDFAASDVDVAIRGHSAPWPGLVSHFLMRMPVAPLASPALLARHPAADTLEGFMALPRISPNDDWWDLWFDTLTGVVPDGCNHPGMRFESQVLDGNAAIAGHGVAILSPPMFQSVMEAGQLVQAHPHITNYRNGFWLVYPERKRGLAKVRAFREWLLADVRAALGDDPFGALVPIEG